ncbi:LacI family DNA-binding transcriptional regulator [Oceanimonas sp. MB9]|uniref:LacI family DNA-binding transcriptional regulator n=1 Tax=Oceanimonas sp. MB9 TaxID=2588453 RepID=UPI0013F62E57|nr:LacI family DNA-binding transcriptional regulator [Oceanimonas sp. MB9]NHI00017.1 HTH-type transcriptional repressor CytR [Oceanimonas sp. MB9]
MSKHKRAGIRQVASLAGVSVATVSRVLNMPDKVSPETAEKVRLAVEQLNFIPNSSARALSTRSTRSIGIVVPTLENLVYAKFLDALESSLAERNYNLVVSTTRKGAIAESLRVRDLVNIGVEALILPGLNHDAELLDYLRRTDITYVLSSVYDEAIEHPTIGYDNYALGRKVARYLVSHGHRNIQLLSGPLENNDRTMMRFQGVVDELQQHYGPEYQPQSQILGLNTQSAYEYVWASIEEKGEQAFSEATALLCLSDVIAIGVLLALEKKGIVVPQDLSVIGFDNLEISEFTNPSLTTVDLPVTEMGKRIAQALVCHLEQGTPLISHLLDAELIIRESVADIGNDRVGSRIRNHDPSSRDHR